MIEKFNFRRSVIIIYLQAITGIKDSRLKKNWKILSPKNAVDFGRQK